LGVGNKLECDGGPFPFPSRDSLDYDSSHKGVKTLLKFKVVGHFHHSFLPFLFREIKFQLSSELQCFPDSQCLHQNIGLHDVVCELPEGFITVAKVVGIQISFFAGIYSTGQNIQQGGFACSTGTHDGIDLASLEDAVDIFEDGFVNVLFSAGEASLEGFVGDLH
jgi:hypothetical protein